MKKYFFGVTAYIVILLVFLQISCRNPAASSVTGGPEHPYNPVQKTLVVFDNTYGICTAVVYDDYRRRDMDKIAEVPAGKCSAELEWTPSISTPFYFAYRITLKGVNGFTVDFVPEVGKDQKAVSIDANTRTVVSIPALDEAVLSLQQLLSPKSYLTITNDSTYSFQLHRGVSMVYPDNSPDSGVVNSGERVPYTVNPGRSADYRLLVGTDYTSFPVSPDRFEAGNFYSYRFTDTVSLDAEIPINLDNVDVQTYTVSFNGNGGSGTVPETQNVRAASDILLPVGGGLSNGDAIFGGWGVDSSGAGIVYSAGTRYTVTGDVTLYAKWYPANTTLYTVTFDSAGGSETASQSMVSGTVAIRPADPHKAGYTFGGWYRDSSLQTPYDFTTPVTESFTLYAVWNANRYTVTFHANGAEGTTPAAVTVDYGIGITLPGAGGLSKQDEIFLGWNMDDSGTGTGYGSGEQYTVTADVTLFAMWYSEEPPPGDIDGLLEMVWVPSGSFEMGKNLGTGEGSDENPVHSVTLSGFYMGKYEVTQTQYEAVMETNPSSSMGDDLPVEMVSWYDALVFCNKLSMAEDLTPAYRISNSTDPSDWGSVPTSSSSTWDAVAIVNGSNGYRLPTEAQWEYAAKGGGSPGSYTYAGSDNPDGVAWYSGNAGGTTHEVGTKAPNGLGIYDMSGNVSEWCWDRYGNYSSATQTNPTGASSGSVRVMRGGHRGQSAQFVNSVFRYNSYQYLRNGSHGFRLVRPATYTVTFDLNEGTGTTPAAHSGPTITLPSGNGFSRSGYTFGGWNTNASGTGNNYSAGSSYTVTDYITLYARWIELHTVTFDINGGTGTNPAARTVNPGSSITLPNSTGFSKSGYGLGSWNTDASGTGSNYSAGSSYTVTENITLYAKWIELTVTFDINGGTGTYPATQSGPAITLPGGDGFSRNGYTFGGWNTNDSGTGSNYSAGSSYTVTGDITLYAKWIELYTVIFDINGGTGTTPAAQTAGSGSTVMLPNGDGFSRSGYIFGGWNTDPSGAGTNYNAGSSYTVTGDVTLYAKWMVEIEKMIFVPGGSFQMGNPDSSIGNSNERPVHTVTLSGFYMGKYEVTQAQYQAVMGTNPSGSNLPVANVSWYDALVFCNKLSMQEGLTPAYRINNRTDPATWGSVPTSDNSTWNAVTIVSGSIGYRLPTEAQWEYAAKGGNGSPGNYTYAGSNNPDEVAWYSGNSGSTSHAVGTKAPNGLGLYDMSGNVYEWCWDWEGDYTRAEQTDPQGGVLNAPYRMGRGGGWNYSAENVRSAYRNSNLPFRRLSSIGFRLVRPDDSAFSYTVTFDLNGGTGTTPATQTANQGSIVTLPSGGGFSRSGNVFSGWNADPSGAGINHNVGSSYTVTGNVTLYAKWNATITFNLNGGIGTTPTAQTASSSSTITLPSGSGFSRSGYTFGGWNTDPSGTGTNYNASDSYTVTGDVTLYAKWVPPMEMVFVPGGSFQMGKDLGTAATGDVTPVQTVTLGGFYMGKYEVTQAQYQAVMGTNPSSGYGVGYNYPVYSVSWCDALVFCNKLSMIEGLTPVYRISNSTNPDDWGTVPTDWNSPNIETWSGAVTVDGNANGYRLPTHAEWEYAAKGGNGSPGNYTYAGSNNPNEVAWYNNNGGSTSHEVGTKAPNGLGLYDMSGNVREWCYDIPPYTSSTYRGLRGGNWDTEAEYIRSVYYWTSYLYGRSYRMGFRLVRPAQ